MNWFFKEFIQYETGDTIYIDYLGFDKDGEHISEGRGEVIFRKWPWHDYYTIKGINPKIRGWVAVIPPITLPAMPEYEIVPSGEARKVFNRVYFSVNYVLVWKGKTHKENIKSFRNWQLVKRYLDNLQINKWLNDND